MIVLGVAFRKRIIFIYMEEKLQSLMATRKRDLKMFCKRRQIEYFPLIISLVEM